MTYIVKDSAFSIGFAIYRLEENVDGTHTEVYLADVKSVEEARTLCGPGAIIQVASGIETKSAVR